MSSKSDANVTCGCMVFIVLLNLILGGVSFQYCLFVLTGGDVNWVIDLIGGILLGEFTIPLAFVFWVLSLVGFHFPLFHV